MEEFNAERQLAKVSAGLKGGPFFEKPVTVPARQFVNGVPSEVLQVVGAEASAQGSILDPWVYRTGRAKK